MKRLLYVLLGVSVLLNVVLVVSRPKNSGTDTAKVTEYIAENQARLPYVSGATFFGDGSNLIINFTPLREALNSYIASKDFRLGVYFEYLPTGGSVGVNDHMEVKIASLAKVPVAMAVYREIEKGSLKESDSVEITASDIDKNFGDFWKEGVGASRSVKELVRLSIQDSDNTATNMLVGLLPRGAMSSVFGALDLPREREGPFPILSPKSYSSVLNNLYLASYNSKEHSNKILELMTATKFRDKLPAGVPEEVPVAHKIGVFNLTTNSDQDVYSDCGIVYPPNRPYMLCIMSESSEEVARENIAHISNMVFGYVSRAAPAR